MQSVRLTIQTASLPNYVKLLWFFKPKEYAINIPSSWDELEAKDVLPCMSILMKENDKGKASLKLLRHFLPVSKYLFYKVRSIDFYEKLMPLVDWMFDTPMNTRPLKGVKYNGTVYLLPSDHLSNMTLWEYSKADESYMSFLNTGDHTYWDRLIAILLRPTTNNQDYIIKYNDQREPFHPHGIEARQRLFNGLPDNVKFYVANLFAASKLYLLDVYSEAFEADDSDNVKSKAPNDWEDIITDLAETKIFGDIQSVRALPIHSFFKWLKKNRLREKEQQNKALQSAIQNNHKKFLA